MFTVGACGLEQVISMRPRDTSWVSALRGLGRSRKKGDVLMMPHLATLSRYLPRKFAVNVTNTKNATLELKANENVTRSLQLLPFVPCKVHVYRPSEAAECVQKYKDTGSPLRIAYVGDSRVRNTMQQMIRAVLSTIDLKLAGEQKKLDINLEFLDRKSHVNVPVVGEGVELRLHWSAFLDKQRNPEDVSKQGARDLLEAWAAGTPSALDGPIPDIVYISSGLWDTAMNSEDAAVDEFMYTLRVMSPILEKLSQLTRVIWHVHGPIKKWVAIRDVPNTALDMMNRAAWMRLEQAGVWLWDTHTVMMLKQHVECQALHRAGLSKLVPHTWGCLDFQHAGHDVEDAAANMLWNLVCNRVLNVHSDHCC